MKQNQVDEILQQINSLQIKLDSISDEFSKKTENLNGLDEKISKKQEELDRIKDVIEAEQKTTNNLIQTQVTKIGEIQNLSDELDSRNLLLQQLETKIQAVQDKLNDQNDQKVTMDSVLEKYQTQLSQKMYEFTTIDSKLGDQKSQLEEMQAKEKDLENLLNLKEQRVAENSSILKKLLSDIEIKRGEYNAKDIAQTKFRDENENLAKIHQEIEQNIQESNVSFQKLKKDLEIQEKQIRDKESRIHRLEIFSFLYRISKIFGGFVLGIGLLFLIVSFGFLFGVINSTEIAWSLVQPLLMLSGLLFIVSGILQLERM
jgi:chromosome segregation ATPase